MKNNKIKREKELEEFIFKHKRLYYTGNAEISDIEFDKMEDELRKLNPENEALSTVGFDGFNEKIQHKAPMLSLGKTRDPQDICDWLKGEKAIASYKMDGSAASLVFHKQKFLMAKTRGNGIFGENLTDYMKYLDFPKKITFSKKDIEIRGEICITKSNFEKLSEEMIKRELPEPNSIRNVVAGLLHRKDHKDLCSYLDFIAYDIDDDTVKSEKEEFELFKDSGFSVPVVVEDIVSEEDIKNVIENYQNFIDEYQYLTDGLVFAIDDFDGQKNRGFTEHHPKGKLAFKFSSDLAETTVRDIEVNVGRTGKISFVGILEPVKLSGATIERVTFHNVKYIKDQNLNIGAKIQITRSGEVIPKHEKTLKTNGVYVFLKKCPFCKKKLTLSDTQIDLYCTNMICLSRAIGNIGNWIKVVGIDELGEETIQLFYKLKLVRCIEDLYKLTIKDIMHLENFGERSATNIINSIQSKKEISLVKFLTALGIEGMGKGNAKVIATEVSSFEELLQKNEAELFAIHGIGDVLAKNILKGVNGFGNKLFKNLKDQGINILPSKLKNREGDFAGKTFVITGTLSKSRGNIVSFIEDNGGKVSGSVSKNTSFLLCNEPSSSSKYKKAEKLSIKIITEKELFGE